MSGLWTNAQVPKSSWLCDEVIDLGEQREICQMCGKQEIRFQHVMHHELHPNAVLAGCVCAGKMEGNPLNAVSRERAAKRKAKLLETGLDPDWKWAMSGNPWFKYQDWRCTVFPDKAETGWKYVLNRGNAKPHFGRNVYVEQQDAMQAASSKLVSLM